MNLYPLTPETPVTWPGLVLQREVTQTSDYVITRLTSIASAWRNFTEIFLKVLFIFSKFVRVSVVLKLLVALAFWQACAQVIIRVKWIAYRQLIKSQRYWSSVTKAVMSLAVRLKSEWCVSASHFVIVISVPDLHTITSLNIHAPVPNQPSWSHVTM